MRRSKALAVAAALCLLVGAAACAGDKGESKQDLIDDISATLQSGGQGFDEETADCFAEIVVDEVGVEALKDVDITADEPPAEIKDDISAATIRASDECDLASG